MLDTDKQELWQTVKTQTKHRLVHKGLHCLLSEIKKKCIGRKVQNTKPVPFCTGFRFLTYSRGCRPKSFRPIGTASANSVESDLGCISRVFFHNVTLASHNVTQTSQRPCQYNNKFDCSDTNGYNIPQDAINEVYVFFSIKYRYCDILLKTHNFHLFC